jgi:cellulose synthase/poly-beta-1,6-N-acetylglucosamine synthase-like glycosyltransferase
MQLVWPVWSAARLLQLLLIGVSFYQAAITAAGQAAGRFRRPVPAPPADWPKLAIIVCARNEARVIGLLLDDLLGQSYPTDRVQLVVVAHNCDDATAAVASRPGVRVIEARSERPGKRFAIRAALPHLWPDLRAVGVIDADSRVEPGFLAAVAAGLEGEVCVQVETVPQPAEGWFTHGYGLDRRARNLLWWKPRAALGLGATISGSGWFLDAGLARQLIPELRGLTEDLELTALLALAGHRVRFLSTTRVLLQEPGGIRPLVRQRTRWARGHFAVVRLMAPPLLRRGFRGDVRALDLALYLLLPTRVITRTAVTLVFVSTVLGAPWRLPLRLVGAAMAAEWLFPAVVAARARLVPLNAAGARLALRLGVIGLLWFPIGLWAMLTSRWTHWEPATREVHDGDRPVPVA